MRTQRTFWGLALVILARITGSFIGVWWPIGGGGGGTPIHELYRYVPL